MCSRQKKELVYGAVDMSSYLEGQNVTKLYPKKTHEILTKLLGTGRGTRAKMKVKAALLNVQTIGNIICGERGIIVDVYGQVMK